MRNWTRKQDHAAKLQSIELAEIFLRRTRETASSERKNLDRKEVLVQLAKEIGFDVNKFSEDLEGKAENDFKSDLAYSRSLGVTGFPAFLVRNKKCLGLYIPESNCSKTYE